MQDIKSLTGGGDGTEMKANNKEGEGRREKEAEEIPMEEIFPKADDDCQRGLCEGRARRRSGAENRNSLPPRTRRPTFTPAKRNWWRVSVSIEKRRKGTTKRMWKRFVPFLGKKN